MEPQGAYNLKAGEDRAMISGKAYHLDKTCLVMLGGQEATLSDILPEDRVRISGIGNDIYSIEVTHGHGYVSLSSVKVGEDDLTGAYLEIGDRIASRVTDRMLVSVPEGEYNVVLVGKGASYETSIAVERDRETVIDTSMVEIEHRTGMITFEVSPENVEVRVDGEKIDPLIPQKLEYGDHIIEAKAEGYEDVRNKLHVASSRATVAVEMKKEEEKTDKDKSGKDSSGSSSSSDKSSETTDSDDDIFGDDNAAKVITIEAGTPVNNILPYSPEGSSHSSASSAASSSHSSAASASTAEPILPVAPPPSSVTPPGSTVDGYYVYVDDPAEAELYLDGEYIGIVPVSFARITGSHRITLKRTGYKTRSYTISISSDKSDKTYSFPDMEKEESSVSDNDAAASYSAKVPSGSDMSPAEVGMKNGPGVSGNAVSEGTDTQSDLNGSGQSDAADGMNETEDAGKTDGVNEEGVDKAGRVGEAEDPEKTEDIEEADDPDRAEDMDESRDSDRDESDADKADNKNADSPETVRSRKENIPVPEIPELVKRRFEKGREME
jgi:hypothetical protein